MVVVDSFENSREFLKSLGFVETHFQQNYRTVWHYKDAEIVLDEWSALDPYIEIEAGSEAILEEVATDLGLNWSEKTIVSVDEL